MADPSEDKYRFSCLASAVVGLLCFALSSNSLLDLFGKWNFLKIFLYSIFSFIFCLVIWFAKTLQNLTSLRINENSPFSVFIVPTVYSFYFNDVSKKPDAYSVISRAAFAIMSLFSSRRTNLGCEVDLLHFFCIDLTLQLMKIEFPLVIVGVAFYFLIYLLKIDAPANYICRCFSPLSFAVGMITMRLSPDSLTWNLLKIFVYIATGYLFFTMVEAKSRYLVYKLMTVAYYWCTINETYKGERDVLSYAFVFIAIWLFGPTLSGIPDYAAIFLFGHLAIKLMQQATYLAIAEMGFITLSALAFSWGFLIKKGNRTRIHYYAAIFLFGLLAIKLMQQETFSQKFLAALTFSAETGFISALAYFRDLCIKIENHRLQNQDEPPVHSRVGSDSEETSNVHTNIQMDSPQPGTVQGQTHRGLPPWQFLSKKMKID